MTKIKKISKNVFYNYDVLVDDMSFNADDVGLTLEQLLSVHNLRQQVWTDHARKVIMYASAVYYIIR